jgi:hypothetical protein
MASHEYASARRTIPATLSFGYRPRQAHVLVAVVALAAVLGTSLIDFGAYHLRYPFFDANSALSWSHRLDAVALAAAVGLCVTGIVRSAHRRGVWLLLTAILTFFAVDEITSLHAHVDAFKFGKLLYAPILLVMVACTWTLMAGTEYGKPLVTGLALLLGSYLIHLFGHGFDDALGWGANSWGYQVRAATKEGLELGGLLIAVSALAGAALRREPAVSR